MAYTYLNRIFYRPATASGQTSKSCLGKFVFFKLNFCFFELKTPSFHFYLRLLN